VRQKWAKFDSNSENLRQIQIQRQKKKKKDIDV